MSSLEDHGGPCKVLLFVDNLDQGGTESQLVRLANGLAADPSFDVHVGFHRAGPLADGLALPPSRMHAYPREGRLYTPSSLRQIARLAAAVRREGYAVIHAQDFYANVTCAAAVGWQRTPRLVLSRRYEVRSHRRIHRAAERWSYRVAHAVVLNSPSIARRLVADGVVPRHKVTVIPNGIDLRHHEMPNGDGPRAPDPGAPCRVGIVARLHPVKDHASLIRAVANLVPRWPNLHAVLVGDGTERERLERLATALGIRERLHITGMQADVRPWLAGFDVAVLASLHEGFPNAILEYLAAGRPVVATAVGGVGDIVRHDVEALLVPAQDPTALGEAIHRLLADPALRTRLAQAGRLRVAQFTVDQMVDRTKALYRQLTSARPSSAVAPGRPEGAAEGGP